MKNCFKFTVFGLIVATLLSVMVAPAMANIPNPGPDPESAAHWYDREGTRYMCLDTDPDLGCLYNVENKSDHFILYWVGFDGIRRSYQVPKNGWGNGDGMQFAAEGYSGGWRIYIYQNWEYNGYIWVSDPYAYAANPYPCCDDGYC